MRAAVAVVLIGGLWVFSLLALCGIDAMAQSTTPPAAQVARVQMGSQQMELSALQSLLSIATGLLGAGILLGATRMRLQRAEEKLAENKATLEAFAHILNQLKTDLATNSTASAERTKAIERLDRDVRRLLEGFARMKGAQEEERRDPED